MANSLQDQVNEISGLMEKQLRVRGADLSKQIRKAGRLLPRAVRHDALYLAQAVVLADNPKLFRMIDRTKADKAHANVVSFLEGISPRERMANQLLGVTASIALMIVAVFVVGLYVLVKRGLV